MNTIDNCIEETREDLYNLLDSWDGEERTSRIDYFFKRLRERLTEAGIEAVELTDFERQVHSVLTAVEKLLVEKNKAYGNSALDPIRVFSQADPIEQLKVRIDDKLSRIKRGNAAGEDVIADLLGYLVIFKIAMGKV